MRNKFQKFLILFLVLIGLAAIKTYKASNIYATCCGLSPACDSSNNCRCSADALCAPGSCAVGESCQWSATCPNQCCRSCTYNNPTPTPIGATPGGGGGCSSDDDCNDPEKIHCCSDGQCRSSCGGGGCESCRIQGFKQPSSNANVADQKIDLIDDGTTAQTANPFSYSVCEGTYTVTAETLAGYTINYTACTNSTSCHTSSNYVNSSSWTGFCPGGGYVDLWWHYVPNVTTEPTPIIPSTPGTISGTAQCSGTDSQILWSWGASTGATSYELQTDRVNTFNSGYLRTTTGITSTSYTTINHAYSVGIYARVRARNGTGASAYRTITSSVTTRDCGLTPTGGPIPTCAAPTNLRISSQSCNASQNIDATWAWNGVSGATQYNFLLYRNDGTVFINNYPKTAAQLSHTQTNMSIANIDWCGRVRVQSTDSMCTAPGPYSAGFVCTSINICPTPPPGTISCTLTASPSSGNAPLNVDLTANVVGGSGNTDYRFDAYSDGTYEAQYLGRSATSLTHNTNYTTAGNRIARAQVTRGGLTATCTANINVGSGPTNTPTTNPTNTQTPTNIPTSPSCSCTANMIPSAPSPVSVGGTRSFSTDVTGITAGCSVTRINFASNNTSVATVNPSSDSSSPYTMTATGRAGGSANLSSQVIMNDGRVGCSDSVNLTVNGPTSAPPTIEPTIPPLCSCTSWTNVTCGGGTCDTDEMQQVRTCTPAACAGESRCVALAACVPNTPIPTAVPSCNANVVFSPASVSVNQTSVATAQVSASNGSVDRVDFFISGNATLLSNSDASSPYQASLRGTAPGTATVTAEVFMGGVRRCTDSSTITISQPSCVVNLIGSPGPYKINQDPGYQWSAIINPGAIPSSPLPVVYFSSSNSLVATVNPTSDSAPAYVTRTRTYGPGDTNITARATIAGYECDTDTKIMTVEAPSCTMSLSPDPVEVELGAPRTIYAALNIESPYLLSDVSSVNFTSNPGGIVSLDPISDTTSGSPPGGFQTAATGTAIGTTTVQGNAIFYGIDTCEDTTSVTVINATPWWQVKEGDAIAATGDIKSDIPYACAADPSCFERFMLNDSGDDPGIVSYTGSVAWGEPGYQVSTTGWLARSQYLDPTLYNYQFFSNKLPAVPNNVGSASISASIFTGGTPLSAPYANYYVFRYGAGGTFTLNGNVTIPTGHRVVLMVPNSSVVFNGNINVIDGQSFFMVVTGRDIIIPPTVGSSNRLDTTPHLEGIYFAQNQFITESAGDDADTLKLNIRGTVVGMTINGVYLKRDLDPANTAMNNVNTPAETIEYAPDQTMMYPPFFGVRKIQWREVAP